MNLLEHYIMEVIREEKIQNPENGQEYYQVTAIVDCYGVIELQTHIFLPTEWEQAKANGYYMA